MKPFRSKRKGNAFELKIYKDLKKIGICKRTIGSGNSEEGGDIHFEPHTKSAIYAIECKHLKKVTWARLDGIWKKLIDELKKKQIVAEPAIVYRENNDAVMVMFWNLVNGERLRVITNYEMWKQTL